MKRLTALFLIGLLVFVTGIVLAQDSASDADVVTIELPDILVLCPGESVLPSVREFAQLVVEFNDADDVMVVPFGEISQVDGVTLITIGRVRLTCDTTIEEFAAIDRSPAVEFDETPPQPENIDGIAEAQSGYLVVDTSSANIRSCDQPTCTQVALVHGGDSLVVLGSNGDFDRLWWYVQVNDVHGWIWDGIVAARGDLTDVPVIATDGEPTPPTVYIGYTGNLVYNTLNADGVALCGVQGNSEYLLLGRNADTSWVYVDVSCIDGASVIGWMDANNVAIRNTGNVFVPILDADGNPR